MGALILRTLSHSPDARLARLFGRWQQFFVGDHRLLLDFYLLKLKETPTLSRRSHAKISESHKHTVAVVETVESHEEGVRRRTPKQVVSLALHL